MNLYTFGYRSGKSVYDLESFVAEKDLLVIDIRYNPYSKMFPFWKKDSLQNILKDRYCHIINLGNKNYYKREDPIELLDRDKGIEELVFMMNIGYNCLLLCACENFESCHRKLVAEEVQKNINCEIINI